MAELRGLSVKVPIRFSERTQKKLYETCMAYKELAEVRGAENEMLRELVRDMFEEIEASGFDPMVERQGKRGPYYEEDPSWRVGIRERVRELGIEVDS